eukprot:jgi/Botrbrau1/11756/Bobra.0195s0081.1
MRSAIYVTGLLITAASTALTWKVLYQLNGEEAEGSVHAFEKPWFTTLESVLACWISLLLYNLACIAQKYRRQSHGRIHPDIQQPLLQNGSGGEGVGPPSPSKPADVHLDPLEEPSTSICWPDLKALLLPALCNVLSILLQGEGLRFITASVSQMVAGSCILFTALLALILLRCRLNWLHLTGITLATAGITTVSLAVFLPDSVSPSGNGALLGLVKGGGDPWGGLAWGPLWAGTEGPQQLLLGVLLTLLSQFVLALRLVLEEFAVSSTNLHPLEVLGYQGMWGSVMMLLVGLPLAALLPGSDVGGVKENTWDTLLMLWNSPVVNGVSSLFFLSVVGMNIFGLFVALKLGSVFRAVLLTSRTALVWGVNLGLYYSHVGGGGLGEPWRGAPSLLQLLGFGLLLTGTINYAQGSSLEAAEKLVTTLEGEEEEEGEGGGDQERGQPGAPDQATGPGRSEMSPSCQVLRSSSLMRQPISASAADSVMIPRTCVLVDGRGTPILTWRGSLPQSVDLPLEPPALRPGRLEGGGDSGRDEAIVERTGGSQPIPTGTGDRHRPGYLHTLLAASSWMNSPSSHLPMEGAQGTLLGHRARDLDARTSLGSSLDVPVPDPSQNRRLFPVLSGARPSPQTDQANPPWLNRTGAGALFFRVLSGRRGPEHLLPSDAPDPVPIQDAEAVQERGGFQEPHGTPVDHVPPPVLPPAMGTIYQRLRGSFSRLIGLSNDDFPEPVPVPQNGRPSEVDEEQPSYRPGESPVPDILIASRLAKSRRKLGNLPAHEESHEA